MSVVVFIRYLTVNGRYVSRRVLKQLSWPALSEWKTFAAKILIAPDKRRRLDIYPSCNRRWRRLVDVN